ncbi:DUF916 and DUF3324 domain-containing protein [Enterococcus sp. BWB1-3]|uniref:DUF916 and DUF3324 domain-containing protein n=1 Tax=unclassified Enterococcus TaxID=2608891 RepID=UPI00192158B1|nr:MULTISPECIES: DUF916 and DUF3324 domain-containing protein [unclassified Enterococcus]MBL1229136.1 DUF916 and DUF3324 domain-containing protein [Enterococcus sp. BWB1-3]MCB5952516.1 DUF916 and DUF3324 domain-containing protein [Enterococcus sp. BWT-B8]MCB5953443.1 DUF916 and DUF3324 domain-containing protein [Enterococcus sp. CWB-B31]
MNKRWISLMIGLLYIVGLGGFATSTYAEEGSSDTNANPAGFSYKVMFPENQRDMTIGYFDLRMSPGQQQTVQIELANNGGVEKTVEVSLNGAKTNGNGVIEYGPIAIDNDASLKYDFKDLVKGPETVTLPPGEVVTLDLAITMPEVSYDGVISGGIQLKEKIDEEARKGQTGLINEYAFLIGMMLTETDTEVQPNLELNQVYAGTNNARNTIYVNFSNVEAEYLNALTVEAQITKQGSEDVIYDTKKANMRVAPNSMVDFPISMNGERMEPGDYHARVVATAGDRSWEWDQDFTITDEEADKFNKQDVQLTQEQGINWLLVGLIVGGGLVLGGVLFLIVYLNRKKKKKQRKTKKKRK